MEGILPGAKTLLVIFVLSLIILPATKSLLLDLSYPIIRKADGWISVLALYAFSALVGSYFNSDEGFVYGLILAGVIRLLFLRFGVLIFIPSSGPMIAQGIVSLSFFVLILYSYKALPPSVWPYDTPQPVLYWLLAAGVVGFVIEALAYFITSRRLEQGSIQAAIQRNLRGLLAEAEGEDARELLLTILRQHGIGVELSRLEASSPGRYRVASLVRLLEQYQQVVCGVDAVLKHPFYNLDKQLDLAEDAPNPSPSPAGDYDMALKTLGKVVQKLNDDRELAGTGLWNHIPSLRAPITNWDQASNNEKAAVLRNSITQAIIAMGANASHPEIRQDYELLHRIGILQQTNREAMAAMSIKSPVTFNSKRRRAMIRLLSHMLNSDR